MLKGNENDQLKISQWMKDHITSENWLDISSSDEIPDYVIGPTRTLVHMFQMTFAPDIRERKGTFGADFFLSAAQLIQPHDGKPFVRINNEIRGIARVRVTKAVEAGEDIQQGDWDELVDFDLEEEDLDSGHFTILWNGNNWTMVFDFRSGRAKAAMLLQGASEFLRAARYAMRKKMIFPAIDTLFSACELTAKVQLMLHHSPAGKSKKHRMISTAINQWGNFGNVSKDFLKLFNRLSNERSQARYDANSDLKLPTQAEFGVVEDIIDQLSVSVKPRHAAT